MKPWIAILLFLVGCSESSTPANLVGSPEYLNHSCQYSYTAGNDIVMTKTSSKNQNYFNKTIDLSYLAAIRESSAEKTIEFARTQGTEIFKAPNRMDKTCRTFSALDGFTPDLNTFWNSAVANPEVVGIFLEQGYAKISTTKNSPIIVVREDSNRYVLVHELMHFFFYKERVLENKPKLQDMQDRVRQIDRNLQAGYYSSTKPEEIHKEKSELILELTDLVDQITLYTSLEEVANESILTQEIASGNLQYIPDGRANAKNYIKSSLQFTSQVHAELEKMIREQKEKSFSYGSAMNNLYKAQDIISYRKNQMRLYEKPEWSKPRSFGIPCAHQAQAEKFLKEIFVDRPRAE